MLLDKRSEDRKTPLDWARTACDSLMTRYEPPELPPENRWHYHQGVFLFGMLRLWEVTGEQKYYDYIKCYADHLIDEYGNFLFRRDELDAMQAGMILFTLHQQSGEDKYKIAAQKLMNLFGTLNQTSEGGYWHKDKYPNQMWLDGLYMGGVFAVMYGKAYNEPVWYDRVFYQESLMRKHMFDEATGLLYHAWDESKQMPWANADTGCSPEFWGRSLGWYGMALVDILDDTPADLAGKEERMTALQRFIKGLVRFQDEATGLWYQVVDKGHRADNWLETSCSALFVYTISKAINKGYVDRSFLPTAIKGYEGLAARMKFDKHGLVMPDICIGTSAGDYTNYITRPVTDNDLHGVGAFVLASVEMREFI